MTSELLIGMKLADHSMYPLFELGERGQKSLTLAAAHDQQERVELRLFYKDSELISIKLEKNQVPGKQWGDLQLICNLDRAEGIHITLSMSGEDLVSQLVPLPDEKERVNTEKTAARSNPVLSLILAGLFLSASIFAAFYTGKSISSEAPPPLQTDQNVESYTD